MISYAELTRLTAASRAEAETLIRDTITPALAEFWIADYRAGAPEADIVEVTTGDFNNLFDVEAGRLIAAYGFPSTVHPGRRDASRMKGFPKPSAGYVKGHAIAHQLGGGMDINLVAQDRIANGGAYRVLEREAARHRGCLYFSNWIYDAASAQTPCALVQGLVRAREEEPPHRFERNALVVKLTRHVN